MNEKFIYGIKELVERYPVLSACENDIERTYEILVSSFKNHGKLLIAGNGGSCADAQHIAGELMKGFKSCRKLTEEQILSFEKISPNFGKIIGEKLQRGLPCIALTDHQALNTAFINDIQDGGLYTYAQQLNSLGESRDVFLGISTSGNSKNVLYAAIVAKSKGLKVIGLTGAGGGELANIADVTIKAPIKETFMVQELHLPIYHCLCLMLEKYFFDN